MRKVKIGVIGCGAIAQTMHLPHLSELDCFEIGALCDISQKLLQKVGARYNVKKLFVDFHDIVKEEEIEAVLVLSKYHFEPVIAALQSGKHVLVEKPMCSSLQEAEQMIEASQKNNVKLMVAYMRRFDPGYEYAQRKMLNMKKPMFIRILDIIGSNKVILNDMYDLYQFDDVPAKMKRELQIKQDKGIEEAIGRVPENVRFAYGLLLGLAIHDINTLRGVFGDPKRIISTEIWNQGWYITSTMDYGKDTKGVLTTGATNITKRFDQEFVVFGADEIVNVKFPLAWCLKGVPAAITISKMQNGNLVEKRVLASYETSYKRELKHFYDCIVNDRQPLTGAVEASKDIQVAIKIIEAYKRTVGIK